jgi:hypothetical protein
MIGVLTIDSLGGDFPMLAGRTQHITLVEYTDVYVDQLSSSY